MPVIEINDLNVLELIPYVATFAETPSIAFSTLVTIPVQ